MSKADENGMVECRFKIPATEHRLLSMIADLEGRSCQEQAREFMREGLIDYQYRKVRPRIKKYIQLGQDFNWKLGEE